LTGQKILNLIHRRLCWHRICLTLDPDLLLLSHYCFPLPFTTSFPLASKSRSVTPSPCFWSLEAPLRTTGRVGRVVAAGVALPPFAPTVLTVPASLTMSAVPCIPWIADTSASGFFGSPPMIFVNSFNASCPRNPCI